MKKNRAVELAMRRLNKEMNRRLDSSVLLFGCEGARVSVTIGDSWDAWRDGCVFRLAVAAASSSRGIVRTPLSTVPLVTIQILKIDVRIREGPEDAETV